MSFFMAEKISTSYNGKPVVKSVSFECEKGEMLGILGANGSGKTTLLKSVCNILSHEGKCILDTQVLNGLSNRRLSQLCSYIPQRSGIAIDISVMEVVLMGFNPHMKLLEHPGAQRRSAAMSAIEKVGLKGRENDNYMTLSEGQKQLCILARTLVSDSKMILLDEPESAMDFNHRYEILDMLKCWIKEGGKSAIVTLHDPLLAMRYCDCLLLLKEGEIFEQLSPGADSLDKMEKALSCIYGKVTLTRCTDSRGREHLVMLKE